MRHFSLYLDEDVHPALRAILAARGFDVLGTMEAGMSGRTDAEQLLFAASRSRAILTFNVAHFHVLALEWGKLGRHHAGIILSEQVKMGALLRRVLKCFADLEGAEMRDRVVWLSAYR